jgi:hypothetical protein
MLGEFINEYRKLKSEDQKTFRRWLWANTVVGAILLAGLIVLALKVPGDESGGLLLRMLQCVRTPNSPRARPCVTQPLGSEMLCAGISMSTRLSRWALLTGLAFAVATPTIAEAQADVPDAASLYPGRYAAVCTPGPIFGCVCATDSSFLRRGIDVY